MTVFGNESRFSDVEKNSFVGAAELWTLRLLISTSALEAHSRVYLLIDDIQHRSSKDEFPFQASALSRTLTTLEREYNFPTSRFVESDCHLKLIFYIRRILFPHINVISKIYIDTWV